ncbi:MAG TPA: uroporphyrinogen-III synthase [Burkholderiaceae bacterium]|nr:uroporphyrinogen-III synthase [Burkholderiaceae bacterium]
MRVLVTRPRPQADDWVVALRQHDVDAHALPLIAIDAPSDPGPVVAAWHGLGRHDLAMFVSPNAVVRFFALRRDGLAWPEHTLAGSTGPGTSRALREAGVPETLIVEPAADAPRFDSEALWQHLQPLRDWSGAGVMIVRGESGRDWLASALADRGARVSFVEAYRRDVPSLDGDDLARLQQAIDQPAHHVWVFSSSQAIEHLARLAPDASWQHARAVASHERIAEHAEKAGFGEVRRAAPTLQALLNALHEAGA